MTFANVLKAAVSDPAAPLFAVTGRKGPIPASGPDSGAAATMAR